jgi:hypothetical protein
MTPSDCTKVRAPGVDERDHHDDGHGGRVEHRGGGRAREHAGDPVGGGAREQAAQALARDHAHALGEARHAVEEEGQPGDEAERDAERVHRGPRGGGLGKGAPTAGARAGVAPGAGGAPHEWRRAPVAHRPVRGT